MYPTAMIYKLPYGKFKYDENISRYTPEYIWNLDHKWSNLDRKYFYVFVADISIPIELHDIFEGFSLLVDHEIPPGDTTKKLRCPLNDKKELLYNYNIKYYVISLHMLKFVLEKGYRLEKMHSIRYATQKAFMKKFIDLNNKKKNRGFNK